MRRKRVRRLPGRRRPAWRRALDRWTRYEASDVARALGFLIEGLLIAMIVLAPLPLGSVAPWARSLVFLGACLLLCVWVVRSCLLGRLEIVRNPVWVFFAAYLLILCFQLIPLPHAVLSGLSPRTAGLYAWLVPGYPDPAGLGTVTMNRNATVREIFRLLPFALVLFVFIHHYRDRRQIARMLWALVALGLFESFYGLAEKFSGSPHIFWVEPRDTVSVHGTYYNRNHFAGLMEMVTPAVFGFFLASLATRSRRLRSSGLSLFQRAEQALSRGRGYRNVLLGLVVAAMFLAGVFSLSRGGITGLLIGFLVLFGFTQARGERQGRIVRVFVFVLLAALSLAFYRGVERVVERFDQLIEDESSWEGRKALRRAGARMVEDFPVLGVGGGAFRYVFPAYQPALFGDRAAGYLHNDWLQVACETGAAGAAVAFAGIGVFLIALLRAIRKRGDPYCRLVFAGAFAGVVAMLVHSFVDFNLYMVTANGLVFTVLLGVCHTSAHMKGRSLGSAGGFPVRGIETPARGLRIGLAALVVAACLAGSVLSLRMGLADLAYNQYLTWARGEPELHFFWRPPRVDEAGARDALNRALALQPGSAELHFARGIERVASTRRKILARARERARTLLLQETPRGAETETAEALARDIEQAMEEKEPELDEGSEAFRSLVEAFTDPARRQMAEEIRADLTEAENSFRKAMAIAPAVPWYRMGLAMAYANLLGPGPALDTERQEVDRLVEDALALNPHRPASLFSAARYRAGQVVFREGGLDTSRERDRQILDMFREALHSDPGRYAYPTYAFLVDEARAEPGALLQMTPETVPGLRRLQWFLSSRGLWTEALEAAERVLGLLGVDPQGREIPEGVGPGSFEFGLCRATTVQQMRMLQRLGRSEAWRAAEARYRGLLGIECRLLLEEASRYAGMGRLTEAAKACTDCLAQDWNNLDAFLTLTEVSLLPGASPAADRDRDVLRELLRLVHVHPRPGPAECTRVAGILGRLEPETPTEHLEARLVEALREQGCGDPEEAARSLRALLLVDARPFTYWHQRHLLHYHLGRSLERVGSTAEAAAAYRAALDLAPSHRPSLERLVALGMGDAVLGPLTAAGREEPEGVDPGEETEPVDAGQGQAEEKGGPGEEAGRDAPEAGALTVRERLLALTPGTSWGIDLAGKVELLGISLEGGTDEQGEPSPGLTARFFWEVSDDLDPRGYYVGYQYFDSEGNALYTDWKGLFPEPDRYGENLDGGIGTVLVHWDYLTFPPGAAREVRILVGQKRRGKAALPPLTSLAGTRWLTLGLPERAGEGIVGPTSR